MKIIALYTAAALVTLSGTALAADFTLVDGDYAQCPAGYTVAPPDVAIQYRSKACSVLGTWYIVRLAGGGSMDGSGYGCKVRTDDSRGLGQTLCVRW